MPHHLRDRASDQTGFTLVELLVIILIIGALAAIALPTFLGQRDKAYDSSTKSDVRNAVTHLQACFVASSSCPDTADPLPFGVESEVVGPAEYKVQARSDSGMSYRITRSAADYVRTCGMGDIGSPLIPPAGPDAGCDGGSW